MEIIRFEIPGEAQAQMRPRATTINGQVRMYDHKKSRDYKTYVQEIAAYHMPSTPIEGPIEMRVTIYKEVLKSFSKKKRQEALDGIHLPVTRPDVDNLAKTFMDALNGMAYKDDSQIVTLIAEKRYAEEPYVFIEIQSV